MVLEILVIVGAVVISFVTIFLSEYIVETCAADSAVGETSVWEARFNGIAGIPPPPYAPPGCVCDRRTA